MTAEEERLGEHGLEIGAPRVDEDQRVADVGARAAGLDPGTLQRRPGGQVVGRAEYPQADHRNAHRQADLGAHEVRQREDREVERLTVDAPDVRHLAQHRDLGGDGQIPGLEAGHHRGELRHVLRKPHREVVDRQQRRDRHEPPPEERIAEDVRDAAAPAGDRTEAAGDLRHRVAELLVLRPLALHEELQRDDAQGHQEDHRRPHRHRLHPGAQREFPERNRLRPLGHAGEEAHIDRLVRLTGRAQARPWLREELAPQELGEDAVRRPVGLVHQIVPRQHDLPMEVAPQTRSRREARHQRHRHHDEQFAHRKRHRVAKPPAAAEPAVEQHPEPVPPQPDGHEVGERAARHVVADHDRAAQHVVVVPRQPGHDENAQEAENQRTPCDDAALAAAVRCRIHHGSSSEPKNYREEIFNG